MVKSLIERLHDRGSMGADLSPGDPLCAEAAGEIERQRTVIRTAAGNISSLMCAYPDRFPRHAFQGTYELLQEALEDHAIQALRPDQAS